MPKPFRTTRFVEFSDTDMAGIVHFSSFFRYMEAAEHELLRSLGFSVYSRVGRSVVSFPRVAASCEFLAPIRCEDEVTIEVAVRRVGTKSVTYGFTFRLDEKEVARGEMTSVCCKVAPGEAPESIPIPADWGERLRALTE
jgi:4-hydroxybenzoyl-CoA thioesterase/acyl-CoA thioester hydrolase